MAKNETEKQKPEDVKTPDGGSEISSGTSASKEEMVSIPRTQLVEFLKRLDRVESATDKTRLEQFDNKNKPKELSRVRLNVYRKVDLEKNIDEQLVIMAWRMTIDEVLYESGRGYTEKQIIELTLENGEKVVLNYRDFAIGKKRSQQPAEIVSRSRDEEHDTEVFEVRRVSDQKVFKLDSRFIN